jgi:undecaprenyl-diphosphatase
VNGERSPAPPWGARVHLPVAALVAALVVACVALLDRPAALWAHGLGHGAVKLFKRVTVLGSSVPYLVATALLAPLLHWGFGRARAARRALFVFVAVAVSGLAVDVAKVLFGRWRPKALFEDPARYGFDFLSYGYVHNSFPSGHAATAGAVACALTLLFPRWAALWLGAGALVAASRVVVGAHYPGDVVAGFWFGAVVALALAGARWFRDAVAGADPRHPPFGKGGEGV